MSARGRGGFALMASLWLIVAMSALALHVGIGSRAARLTAANAMESSRAEAAALAGLEHVRSRLQVRLDDGSTIPGNGTIELWSELEEELRDTVALGGDSRYTVTLADTGSRLHLNRASEDDLRRLFRALRIDWGEADRLAQAIADWRDPDDFARGRGAETKDYIESNAPALPRNGSFASIDELRLVRGMTEADWAHIAPHLTIAGNGQINLNTASEEVLLALPGMTPEAARHILRTRRQRETIRTLDELANALSPAAREELRTAMPELMRRTTTQVREVEAVATGWTEGSPVRVEALGLYARGGSHTFFVRRSLR